MRPSSACKACRDRRKKCDRSRPGLSCTFCVKRGLKCIRFSESPMAAQSRSKTGYDSLDCRPQDTRSSSVSSLVIPDATLCEELVELYFRYVHVAFHNLFHRQTFLSQVREGSIPRILFFGVVSLSARFSTHPIFASVEPWDRGRPYFNETKRLLDLGNTSLATIQACMLLAANASVEGEPRTESVYLSIASRMATLLDLPTMPTDCILEQEINRRVWWSVIAADTWNSATHSLPRLIKPRDNIPFPMEEREFASLNYESSPSPLQSPVHSISSVSGHCQSLLAQMIRLNLLLYDITLLNARVAAEQSQGVPSAHVDYTYIHALEEWSDNLSLELRYSEKNVARWVEEGLAPIFIILHINYNHAGQLLFYQYLHSAQDTERGAQDIFTIRSFAKRCKQHATNLCDLIYRAKQSPKTAVIYPLAGHILSLASTVQIYTLLFDDDEIEISGARIRLERNFEMIMSMNHYWPMNHKTISRLQHFHNACLRSQDDSFRLDIWMLQFLLGYTKDMEDRDSISSYEHWSRDLDHLKHLLDI